MRISYGTMRILFVGMRWDYKLPSNGPSFSYMNLYDSLRRMPGIDCEHFAFDEIEEELGVDGMNASLLEKSSAFSPDLVFFFFYRDEIWPETVSQISKETETINWFADDHWRFNTFSKGWIHHLRWVATTYPPAAEAYRRLGFENVLLTQWACNQYLYRPVEVDQDLDLSFVGQAHGDRRKTVSRIRGAGLSLQVWGGGWPKGRLDHPEMVGVFSRSKVNLNLSNSSRGTDLRSLAGLLLKHKGRFVVPDPRVIKNLQEFWSKRIDQIKGRNFEVPGCGAFLLTNHVEDIDSYFVNGEEIVTFTSFDEMVDKARYFLDNDTERLAIARRGKERVLSDHTYERRFREMFRAMNLGVVSEDEIE